MFCNYCGNELAGNSLFCPNCGQKQAQQPFNQMIYPQQMPQPNPAAHNAAVTSLILGIAGLIGWMLPIVGFPISIIGLVYGVSALKKGEKNKAIAGIVLSSISLALTAGNSAVGFYMGYHGLFGRH